jgi:hypothetical protein
MTLERRAPHLLRVTEGGLRVRFVFVGHGRILSGRPATTATQQRRFGCVGLPTAGDRSKGRYFLVVEPEVENTTEESIRLRHALRDLLVPMDMVVMSELDVARWRNVPGTLAHAALADGRVPAA